MLVGNAGLRMCGSHRRHVERDENEWKGQSATHAAICQQPLG